ncbi:MAG TPA: TonB-dependent receptor plug domain-containing protein, partial [Caulobacteraceae bacterium]|nr:TonB-dependent receptor plug domain-containing protein [Caulobacteraceae bacterium]
MKLAAGAGLAVFAVAPGGPALADDAPITVASVTVVAAPPVEDPKSLPVKTATVTRETIAKSINVVNTEDAVAYLPDVLVRKRHIGDTQAPITTRTSGEGSSARSLIYADDVLLSALIGNNNGNASPRWSFVAPQEIDHIDILYGPFAAAYPGNSIGEVVNIVTRLPTKLEAGVDAVGAWQNFSQYSTRQNLGSGQISGYVGDKIGPVAFWLSANHLDTSAQPLAFVTVAQASGASTAGVPVTGALAALNRTASPIEVLGAGSIEHQIENNAKLKLAVDLTPTVTATYSVGVFSNWDRATDQTYLTNAAGAPVFSGEVNIAGRAYNIPASAFSADVYDYNELQVGQSLKIASHTGGAFDWEVVASYYDFLNDRQRFPSGALPTATSGGPGTITDLGGTGWETLDFKGVWRTAAQEISFGLHGDEIRLVDNVFDTSDWITAPEGPLATSALGRTQTVAAWAQDAITIIPAATLTLGARLEDWRAFDGLNASTSAGLRADQPEIS